MNNQTTDSETIAMSIDGPERFAAIFDRHYAEIHRFASRRLGPTHADDIASEVFVRAFKGRQRFDQAQESARPWLYGIASNLIRMHARSERRMLRAFAKTGVDPLDDFAPTAADRASAVAQRSELISALAKLSTRDRELLLLHVWGELSSREIGDAVGMPDATVRTRLARTKQKLANALSETDSIADPIERILAEETRP